MNEVGLLDLVVEEEFSANPEAVFLATSAPDRWVRQFGRGRIRVCAISEPAMVGMAIGAAMSGLRPVVDLNRASFNFLVMDQLVNHAARLHYMSGGRYSVPMVVTSATRGHQQLGPQNEQSPYGVFMQTPGIAVVVPGTLDGLCGLLRSSLRWPGPVAFFVSPTLGRGSGLTGALATPPLPFGRAAVLRQGSAATIVAIGGPAVAAALEAADVLAAEGLPCDVLDPRTLVPFDLDSVRASLAGTGRLILVDDGPRSGAPAQIVSRLFDVPGLPAALGGRVAFVCCPDVPIPSSPELERHVWPRSQEVADAVRALQ